MLRPSAVAVVIAATLAVACSDRRDATAPNSVGATQSLGATDGARGAGAPPGYQTVAVTVPAALTAASTPIVMPSSMTQDALPMPPIMRLPGDVQATVAP